MLFIDQPNQVGFSYDVPSNGTVDQTTSAETLADFSNGVPVQNNTIQVGTFPTLYQNSSANDTTNAARALWHFAQAWFQEFPAYKPNNNAISIFTESYGGRYGPAVAAFFEEQNMRIANGSVNATGDTYIIHLDTLGIVNGCVDLLTQELAYPTFAYNNTYGIQAINKGRYQEAVDSFNRPDTGCHDLIINCRNMAAVGDPDANGNNDTVNQACIAASTACQSEVEGQYINFSGRNYYDIVAIDPDPFPPSYYLGFLSQHWVQAALGVPINYTQSTNGVYSAFQSTGDYSRTDIRGGQLADLAYLLDNGVKVAFMYGDRDYACNWLGGEEASLAVNYSQSSAFKAAGYAPIQVNNSYVGGSVRQYGNFSFSRVYQSGHEVPAYQPETAYRIFQRAIFGNDIATGNLSTNTNQNYSTQGPSSSFQIKNDVPESPKAQCYVLNLMATCTEDQRMSVVNGSALVHDHIVIDANTTYLFPDLNGTAGPNGTSGSGGTGGKTTGSGTGAAPSPTTKGTAGTVRVEWKFIGSVVGIVGIGFATL